MRSLARRVFPYGAVRRVMRGPARGTRFVVAPAMGVTYALATELAMPRWFVGRIRPGMTVLDVGANRGQMALLFASLVGPSGRVVSFEPAPVPFAALTRNVELNRLANVSVRQAAASEAAGTLVFTFDEARPTQGKLRDVETTYVLSEATSFEVEAVRLDDEVTGRVDFIKIDTEGGGASVLRGGRRLLEEHSPGVYIELHGPEEQAGVRDELLSRGYVAESLGGSRVLDPTAQFVSPLWCHKPYVY